MSRHIDADAFEKFIKEKYKDGESTDDIKDQMLFDLSYQPTAFDVEEIVAEMEDLKMSMDCQIFYNEASKLMYKEIMERVNETVNEAIDIVRKGGVE